MDYILLFPSLIEGLPTFSVHFKSTMPEPIQIGIGKPKDMDTEVKLSFRLQLEIVELRRLTLDQFKPLKLWQACLFYTKVCKRNYV